MKKTCFTALILAVPLLMFGQFSLGADVLSFGLPNASQKDIGLTPESTTLARRLVFIENSNFVAAYKHKNWEGSVGLGFHYYYWKQKFNALTPGVRDLVGANTVLDSTNFLGRVIYSSKYITLPIGMKYMHDRSKDWINGFVSVRLCPTFAYHQDVNPDFFTQSFIFRTEILEDPELEAATKQYFESQTNAFLLDAKAELGFRIWGGKRKFAVDFSLGYMLGLLDLHQQMGRAKGIFCNSSIRFYLKNQPEKQE